MSQAGKTAAPTGIHKSQGRVWAMLGWARLQYMPVRAETASGPYQAESKHLPAYTRPKAGNRYVGELGDYPARLQLLLVSARAHARDRPGKERLQQASAYVWARSGVRPGWASLWHTLV